ncbi:MAG TPA: carboxypeptidase-like regulatory domain-containing protein [Chitinophagales bacterium]|nr:carboxypeptidase-like regulatory domain-containing protein [Chitinophagales bacterium]
MLLRFVFIFLMPSIWTTIAHGQSAIILKGKVTDETHQPISSATVVDVKSGRGTYSDQQGNFSLGISIESTTLRISHVGFKDKEYDITATELQHAITNSISIEIILTTSPVEISPVEVFANKQIRAYDKPWIPIIDFGFAGSNLLLLAYEKKKYDVRLVNGDDSILLQTTLSFTPESLFNDCLDQLHVLSADSNYRISILSDTLLIAGSSNRIDFDIVVLPCVAATEKALYVRKLGAHNQSEFYIESNRHSDDDRLFAEVRDSIGEQGAEEEIEKVLGLSGYANAQMAEIFSSADLNLSRAYMNDLWFYQEIRTIPIYDPLKKIRDSLYLFNHVRGRLSVYDEDGKIFRVLPLTYAKDKNWNKQIVVDESNEDVYMAFISNGYITLKKFDLSSGNFVSETQLDEVLFPESIKIRNGIAYYLRQHSGEYPGYNIFMQHLN